MSTTFGIHPAHRAEDWTDPDPNAHEPFTGQHFAYWEGVPAVVNIMKRYNTYRRNTNHIQPKQGRNAYNILPALPVASRDDLIGKVVPMYFLFYSPEELHANAIGYGNPAYTINEKTGRIVSGTYRLVLEFMGLRSWAYFVKFDVHPTTFPYRTSPTEVFAKEDWEEMEKHYHKFLFDIMTHPNVRVYLGSKSTIKLVEEVFGDKLPNYLVRFFTTADGRLVTVVHPEMLHNKKIRGLAFASHCGEYDDVFTQLRREVEGPDAEECTIGSQMLAGVSFDWLVCSGEDIIEYLIANYDSPMLVSHRKVPEMVQGYATKNSQKIGIFLYTRLDDDDSFDFEQLVLSQLHQFMSSNGGKKWAVLAAEAHQFLNNGMGRGESWGDVSGVLGEMGLWDAYKKSINRFLKHVKNIRGDIKAGRIADVGNNKCIVLPNNASTMSYVTRIAKEYDASDWRWMYLSKLNVGDGRLSIDLSRFAEEREKFGTKMANEEAKEEADNFRKNTTESLRRDRARADSHAASVNNPPGPDASMSALISKSTKRGGKRHKR